MIRHLIPRWECGGWYGSGLTRSRGAYDDVRGGSVCIQWLGLMIEIGVGRVR